MLFRSISGAHFNPLVSLLETFWGRLSRKDLIYYWGAQILGALIGVLMTHIMFGLPLFQVSTKVRLGLNLGFSEFVATFGLICTIALAGRKHVTFAPLTIACYITSAYWFTSSTSFANPAATLRACAPDASHTHAADDAASDHPKPPQPAPHP